MAQLAPQRLGTPPRTGDRATVAVNAHASGLRDPELVLEAILAATAATGVDVRGTVTESDEDLRAAIDAAAGGRLVLAGGDGSVHFALNAAGGPIEIGIVPIGRANNIARALDLPADVPRAARRAVTGEAIAVDVLRVETPARALYGIEGVSAGLQADARMRYESVDSGHLIEGASAFVTALGRYEPWRLALELDGRRAFDGPAAELFLSNFPLFAYGFRVDPAADIGDGLLEAIVLEAGSRHRVARLVLSAYRGTLDRRRGVSIEAAREAVIATPLPLVCDSEVLGVTTASVRVEQGRLRIAA
jgi:diacylglycerol kinase (ATP)